MEGKKERNTTNNEHDSLGEIRTTLRSNKQQNPRNGGEEICRTIVTVPLASGCLQAQPALLAVRGRERETEEERRLREKRGWRTEP